MRQFNNNTRAAAAFKALYKGEPNFMTPTIEGYEQIGPVSVEISSGRGLSNNTIYGVTHIEAVERRETELVFCKHTDLNFCTDDLQEVINYIEDLKFRHESGLPVLEEED